MRHTRKSVRRSEMDINQMLPLLFKGQLGEKEQMLLKLANHPDNATMSKLFTEFATQSARAPRVDTYGLLKKIIPAETLGRIIKYFDDVKKSARRR